MSLLCSTILLLVDICLNGSDLIHISYPCTAVAMDSVARSEAKKNFCVCSLQLAMTAQYFLFYNNYFTCKVLSTLKLRGGCSSINMYAYVLTFTYMRCLTNFAMKNVIGD